jgi:small conductance mechanosensitive channel
MLFSAWLGCSFRTAIRKVVARNVLQTWIFLLLKLFPVREVFPRRRVNPGIGVSIARLVNYAVLLAGVLLALATLGLAQDTATAYPAGLDDPSIDLEELQLRLVPLTADQLAPLAAAWQEQARAATQAAVDKSLEIRAAEGPRRRRCVRAAGASGGTRAHLREVLGRGLQLRGEGRRSGGGGGLRDYLSAVRSEGSRADAQEFADSFLKWLVSPEGGVGIGFRIAVIAGSLFGLLIVARIVRAWARRAVQPGTDQISKLLSGFLVMAVYWLTIAFGLMIVLAALGVNITPLFALVGGASFIIAFALQETLGNLAAG